MCVRGVVLKGPSRAREKKREMHLCAWSSLLGPAFIKSWLVLEPTENRGVQKGVSTAAAALGLT